MLSTLGTHVRHNVVGYIALFFALTGVAYAGTLPKNSVGTAQLKKNAVTALKVKKDAVTGPKLRANAVTGAKVKANSLSGLDVNEGALGRVPSASTADTAATAGTADVAKNIEAGTVFSRTVPNPDGQETFLIVSCPGKSVAVGAGVRVSPNTSQYLVDLYPDDSDTWRGRVANDGLGGDATISVVCLPVKSLQFVSIPPVPVAP
jgi:hypothetical protein